MRIHLFFAAALFAVPLAAQSDAPIVVPANGTDSVAVDPNEATTFTQNFNVDDSDRMTVPVTINGSDPIPFIVDTGTERTVISEVLAQHLALKPGPELKLLTITGASMARSYVVENLAMNAVKVDYIEAPALMRSNLGAHGLLGLDSLDDHKIMLDFKAKKMEVLAAPKKRRLSQVERGMIIVNAEKRERRMIISDAYIGGVKVDIVLDTGAQASMGNFALRDRIKKRDRLFDYVPVKLRGVTGDELRGDFTQIKGIAIGGFSIDSLPVTFADNYTFEALRLKDRPAILLGMDALSLFDGVMVDFTNRRVGFKLPATTGKRKQNPLEDCLKRGVNCPGS